MNRGQKGLHDVRFGAASGVQGQLMTADAYGACPVRLSWYICESAHAVDIDTEFERQGALSPPSAGATSSAP